MTQPLQKAIDSSHKRGSQAGQTVATDTPLVIAQRHGAPVKCA